ncbi:hypothetical protein BCR34DRAFT_590132 [Clohesyomyces aquaticus]|uniref:Uncharacterized protein n=1 Tax=Clohesyomyces aquaticus TaxID=1231657 RepID=A0A1Y1ZCC2_9PLEO|nr:hypothetical protein BCR34DRAFT_590132 [Clohesyomyces aquaticus]
MNIDGVSWGLDAGSGAWAGGGWRRGNWSEEREPEPDDETGGMGGSAVNRFAATTFTTESSGQSSLAWSPGPVLTGGAGSPRMGLHTYCTVTRPGEKLPGLWDLFLGVAETSKPCACHGRWYTATDSNRGRARERGICNKATTAAAGSLRAGETARRRDSKQTDARLAPRQRDPGQPGVPPAGARQAIHRASDATQRRVHHCQGRPFH